VCGDTGDTIHSSCPIAPWDRLSTIAGIASITGASVERQPFGEFKLSGLGSQAGGPDYLRHFLIPRTITENTPRAGIYAAPIVAIRDGEGLPTSLGASG
jgi:hypothetical protein